MNKAPTLPPDSKARIENARATARGELRRELVKYWLEIAGSEEAWRIARPIQLADLFSKFAEHVFKAQCREYARQFRSESDYRLFLRANLVGRVVDEIVPVSTQEIMAQIDASQRGEAVADLPPNETRGEWEKLIQESWVEARWQMSGARTFREIERHPFQTALRQPVRRKRITAPIIRLLEGQRDAAMATFWEVKGETGHLENDAQAAEVPERVSREPQLVATPATDLQFDQRHARAKPGPKRDRDTAWRVKKVVEHVAGAGRWQDKLDEICDQLDQEQIPRPKGWGKKSLNSWTDAAVCEKELAKKAISHHLKNSQN